MHILEYGHIKPKEVKCNHCGAILEYTPADINYPRPPYRVPFIVCPVCKKGITSDNNLKHFEVER